MTSIDGPRVALHNILVDVSDPYPLELIRMMCDYVPMNEVLVNGSSDGVHYYDTYAQLPYPADYFYDDNGDCPDPPFHIWELYYKKDMFVTTPWSDGPVTISCYRGDLRHYITINCANKYGSIYSANHTHVIFDHGDDMPARKHRSSPLPLLDKHSTRDGGACHVCCRPTCELSAYLMRDIRMFVTDSDGNFMFEHYFAIDNVKCKKDARSGVQIMYSWTVDGLGHPTFHIGNHDIEVIT